MESFDINAIIEDLAPVFTAYALQVIAAIVILIVGWIAAGWAKRATLRMLNKSDRMDETVAGFVSSLVRYAILMFTVVAVAAKFGIETTSFIAVLGAMGLAIGLALQGTLGHVASGVMLLLFRPFKVGDFVEVSGQAGSVKAITLFTTEMATGDNVQIILPNGAVWGSAIKNYSFHPTRRVDLTVGIGYGDNIDKAIDTVRAMIAADDRALRDPEPQVAVTELGDSTVNILFRVWVNSGDYWAVRWDLTKQVKEQFDANDIEIPFPQQVLHIEKDQ